MIDWLNDHLPLLNNGSFPFCSLHLVLEVFIYLAIITKTLVTQRLKLERIKAPNQQKCVPSHRNNIML